MNSSFLSELLAIDTVFMLKTAYAGLLFDSVLMLLPAVPLQFAGAVKTKYLSAL